MSDLIHMQAIFTGKCTRCRHYNEVISHDYGRLTFEQLDAAMDHVNHEVKPMTCTKCGGEFPAEFLIYRDAARNNVEVEKVAINHDYLDPETSALMQKGHEDRYLIFEQHRSEFWSGFNDYAVGNWTTAVAELSKAEIAQGFAAIGDQRILKTDTHARKEAQKVIGKDRETFWQAANQAFVQEILEIGAMGWVPLQYAKHYGANRTRHAIMQFPIGEGLESLRTQYMGMLFKQDRGDNAFLLRRISQLTEDATKQIHRYNKLVRQHDEQKHIIADLQDKIGKLNAANKDLVNQQPLQDRSSEDVRRIRELKSFITELLAELNKLRPALEEDLPDPPELVEVNPESAKDPTDFSSLSGKTIGIIGGWQKRTVTDTYPCQIITHDGRKHDPDFYALLQEADILVILTKYISHASMWAAKAYGKSENKPVYALQEINVLRILEEINKKNDI